MKLVLPSGIQYGEGPNGKRICRGAQMGRVSQLPENREASIKLRIERLKWVDSDYDQGGAYWGNPHDGRAVYCAWGQWGIPFKPVFVFVWASNREEAKRAVRNNLPNATFFR